MTDRPLEFEAAADGHLPLLPDHAPDPRHRVREHERTIPPRPIPPDDPDVPRMLEVPVVPRTARKVPVKAHVRKNPRRKETEMTTLTPSTDRLSRAAAMANARARATDPATSHAAAASANVNASQEAVLHRFLAHALAHRTLDHAAWPTAAPQGYTDEELVDAMDYESSLTGDVLPWSPSRVRTARRELTDLGLLVPTGDRRPTKRGRQADVYDLTERGAAFEVEA